jgi:ssDNA-binding Zn-finger/Zn-ribbon topoisomerase 1
MGYDSQMANDMIHAEDSVGDSYGNDPYPNFKKMHRSRKQYTGKGPCPYCMSKTVLRSGPHGSFYGCVKFPKCKGTRNI